MPPLEITPLETHWSRILHYDLFDADALRAQELHVPPHKEPRMPSSDPFRDPPPIVERSPMIGALVLLGIYVVMYLSVAAALHVLEPANASTVEGPGAAARAAAETAAPIAAIAGVSDDVRSGRQDVQLSPTQTRGEEAPADCRPGAPFDTRCFTD